MKPLLLLAILSFFGTKPSRNKILYRQLTWADFRGPIDPNQPMVNAATTTEMELSDDYSGDSHIFRARAYFLPDSSFVRYRSDSTLRHEQTHFQIACIAARKCSLVLATLDGEDSTAAAKADVIFDRYCLLKDSLNQAFDDQTHHGQLRGPEKAWEGRMSMELVNLNAY